MEKLPRHPVLGIIYNWHDPIIRFTPAAPVCIRTPELARAVLRIILTPLIALIEARIAAALNQLLGMMQEWRDGTLAAPPPERPCVTRQTAPRPYSARPAQAPSWLDALFALAMSDEPASESRPHASTASASRPSPNPRLSPVQPEPSVAVFAPPLAPKMRKRRQLPGATGQRPYARRPVLIPAAGRRPEFAQSASGRHVASDPPLRPPDIQKSATRAFALACLFHFCIKIN